MIVLARPNEDSIATFDSSLYGKVFGIWQRSSGSGKLNEYCQVTSSPNSPKFEVLYDGIALKVATDNYCITLTSPTKSENPNACQYVYNISQLFSADGKLISNGLLVDASNAQNNVDMPKLSSAFDELNAAIASIEATYCQVFPLIKFTQD